MKKTILLILITFFANSLTSMDQHQGDYKGLQQPAQLELQQPAQQQQPQHALQIQQDQQQQTQEDCCLDNSCYLRILIGGGAAACITLTVLAFKTNVFEKMAGWFS